MNEATLFILGFVSGVLTFGIGFLVFSKKYTKNQEESFELMARRIFDESSQKLSENSKGQIQLLLDPLKERILEFQNKVEKVYTDESRERFSLKNEIKNMNEMGLRMADEANHLTKALKGDVKTQGNWGEVVLERILETSGLRNGEEYVTQASAMKLTDESGSRYRPDVVVLLPGEGHVVVDSKVSLVSYEKYMSSEENHDRESAYKEFRTSIQKHIDDLSSKAYQKLDGLNSPEFVLLFVPIEGAYTLALSKDDKLLEYAWKKNIALVSPTTLMVTLKTISSLWKLEKQSKNAEEIAKKAGLMYDKFVGFYNDLVKVGDSLKKTRELYDNSMNKLHSGRGNLISKSEELKELGIKSTKELPPVQ
jgi:DNA recombination protein RmuC